ncbi:M28 family peptidase [Spirosoma foliorum]|uniref:M28 family peptidase n=1 Tax=Spirosoma foliorum TaxID=2710596 RepID=A0A7G5GQF9_9BACT|nr:M28 family peptidase [Spirosoma foliorum]QMW01101.1 M28 family peptidase [Spirosoma foliorum]
MLRSLLMTLTISTITLVKVCAQVDVSKVLVSDSLLKKHVYLLASDSLQGRETGKQGQRDAALYCTRLFRQSHLISAFRLDSVRGSYRQTFPFTITEVAMFGTMRERSTVSGTYKRHELAPWPLTAKDSSQVLFGDNIGGFVIGTDLKREVVVVSAHYDHLGNAGGRTFHGADDNASGTASVLAIAAVVDSLVQQGVRPRRSILFVLFSGEEGGLLGSDFFMGNSPIPRGQYICDLNVDMVGRIDDAHRKKPNYCYLLTDNDGTALRKTAEAVNQQSVNLVLNKGGYDTDNDPMRFFERSDQYNFAKTGIPALFFTSGEHYDYHKPSDTADKIAYDMLQKRATLVFQTAWRVANPTP